MSIHAVQHGESVQSIADSYGLSSKQLILDNGLENQPSLVDGQSLIIAVPETTYTVKDGDTLSGIVASNNVTLMQLYRNNPFLSERQYIYPGETLVIKYPTKGSVTTHGNTIPFIKPNILKKTLPFLTYLSILNFTATKEGEIITYYDDNEIIRTAKEYGVIPLMLITTLSLQGTANIGIAYDILLNKEYQEKQIENILDILKTKGYSGVNITFDYMNSANQELYESYFNNIAKRLNNEGYLVFATLNSQISNISNQTSFEMIDLTALDQMAHNIIFMNYEWASNINPPSPISSISNIDYYLESVSKLITPSKEIIGIATIGYDWELPFSAGLTSVYALTIDSAIDLAYEVGAVIQFDEVSMTPFYTYSVKDQGREISHIVWFIDVRSIDALLGLVTKYSLHGVGIWNITVYNPGLWVTINSQFEINKLV